MARAPFQILVFPFIVSGDDILYGLFRRHAGSGGYWQGIAGGGEDEESPQEAALREAWEEGGISGDATLYPLQSQVMLPVADVCGFLWGPELILIPEYAYGIEVVRTELLLSREHSEAVWRGIDQAMAMVKWDSNRTALWELHYRIRNGMLPSPWGGPSSVP